MLLLRVKVNGVITHIPTREIVEIQEETPTSTLILTRSGRKYTVADRRALFDALQKEDASELAFGKAGDSLFDRIFGRV